MRTISLRILKFIGVSGVIAVSMQSEAYCQINGGAVSIGEVRSSLGSKIDQVGHDLNLIQQNRKSLNRIAPGLGDRLVIQAKRSLVEISERAESLYEAGDQNMVPVSSPSRFQIASWWNPTTWWDGWVSPRFWCNTPNSDHYEIDAALECNRCELPQTCQACVRFFIPNASKDDLKNTCGQVQ